MTSGYEFTTAITNVVIVIASLYAFLKTSKEDKKWKSFFLLVVIDGIFGIVIHGIIMPDLTKKILWGILSFLFSITINLLIIIFLSKKYKKAGIKEIIFMSLGIYSILFLEMIFNKPFLFTYIMYALLAILLITYVIVKNGIKKNLYYFIGILCQYIGGLFLIFKKYLPVIPVLNHNGIYHLFMAVTVILFYLQNKNKKI